MAEIKTNYNQYFVFLVASISFIFGLLLGYMFFGVDIKSKDESANLYEEISNVLSVALVDKGKLYNISNQSPEKFLATVQSALMKAIKDEDFNALEDLFKEYFAIEDAAKVALGRLWYTLDKKAKDEFLAVFSSYIATTYYSYAKEIIRHADDIVIQSIDLVSPDSDTYRGRMIIVRNTEGNINVGFTIRQTNNGFKLIDFTAFRISFSISLRRLLKPHTSYGIGSIIKFLEKETEVFSNKDSK